MCSGPFRHCSPPRATLSYMYCFIQKLITACPRQLKSSVVTVIALLSCQFSSAETVQLHYQAFLGGASAGSARLALDQDAHQYSVIGSAKSKGLMESFNPWRAQFEARGSAADGGPVLEQYHYVEKDDRKLREVTVSEGLLRVVKNGKLRAELDALPGLDILTALFVKPKCDATLDLHTGRHGYQLVSTKASPGGAADICRYRARDDEGDSYQVTIEFAQIGELRVPRVIELNGFLSGRMKLESYKLTTPALTPP